MTTILAIFIFILGLIFLALSRLESFEDYKMYGLIAAILSWSVAIGIYIFAANFNLSPISPLASSPLPAPTVAATLPPLPIEPTIKEVSASEIGFKGCLLFVSNRSGPLQIHLLKDTPNNVTSLTNNTFINLTPRWSPDGKKIIFASMRENESTLQIYTMNVDGSQQQRLGNEQPGTNSYPSWSPDGKQVMFQSNRDTNSNPADDSYDIYIMNADGTNPQTITLNQVDDTQADWSPDGQSIAFLSERTRQDEVYMMKPDGTQVQQLTSINELKSDPHWLSDNKHILFENKNRIYKLNIETKEKTPLAVFKNSNDSTPIQGQNDNIIIFSSDHTGNWELYVADFSNAKETRVAQLTNEPGVDRYPAWYPCN